MKISFTDVKGQNTAPAHHGTADGVYKVDAFTGGYGSGAVRGINVSALESKGVDGSGNRTYIDPEAMDKVGGSYTWTNKKGDINITRYDNVGEGYKSPSHKLDFDEIVSNPAEFDYLRRKGVEGGYNGTKWSCVTERDKLPLVEDVTVAAGTTSPFNLFGKKPLSEDVVYEVTIGTNKYKLTGVATYSNGKLATVTIDTGDGNASATPAVAPTFKAVCHYNNVVYDVYYSDDLGKEEVAYQHGTVYTRPKVEPKQWRTKTTTAGVTTYGPWKLLSAETPTGTEGTDYEYMLEAYIERNVCSVTKWAVTMATVANFAVREYAEVTDEIHGDVVSKVRTPEILENLNAYKHKDNENYTHSGSAGVVKTRRVKRGASNKPEYTTISKKANWSAATNYISATSAQLGQPIEFYVGNGYIDTSSEYKPMYAGTYVSTMGGTTIPQTAFTHLDALKDDKYSYKITLANVTGPIVISGTTEGGS